MQFTGTIWSFAEITFPAVEPGDTMRVCNLFNCRPGNKRKKINYNKRFLIFKTTTMKQNFNAMKTAGCLGIAAMLTIISCKKDNNSGSGDQATAISLMSSASASQSLYDDAFDVVTQEGESNSVSGRIATCATVTITPADSTTWPKTMTIDFGSGCTSANGITRKGKIVATLSNKIRTTGTTISVAFVNYLVNDYKVEGTYSITNSSGNGNGLSFTTQVSGGKITYPDGAWYSYTGTHTLTQTGGTGTITFLDDVFTLTGNCTAASSAGNSLTAAITTPIVKNNTCKNIVSGVDQFTYNGISGSLNFGDGTCDNQALLTIGSTTRVIILPR